MLIINWLCQNDYPVVYVSGNVKELLNYSVEEFKNPDFRFFDIVYPDDAHRIKKDVQANTNENKDTYSHAPYRIKKKNGDYIWVLVYTITVKDENGNITNYLGYLVDISDHISTQKELGKAIETAEQSNRKLNIIVENLKGIIYRCSNNKDRTMEYISPAVLGLTGYTEKEMTLNNEISWGAIIFASDRENVSEEIQKAIAQQQYFSISYRIIDKQGALKWVWEQGLGIFKNNKLIAVEGFIHDITEQKNIENELINARIKAEQSSMLQTEFLQNMSHEIRTPMNGIVGFARLLVEEDLTKDTIKNYTNIISASSEQLLKIIDDILEISKLETKQIVADKNEVNLNNLLTNIFITFDTKAKENRTPLYLRKPLNDIQITIISDELKLNKIISNILENSIKYTSQGFIELGYTLKDQKIIIYISDTGIGIEPAKQRKIFERFSQEEDKVEKRNGGLGLGLSIAKENAELIGGNITLDSQKGEGTTFYVEIPYTPVANEQTDEQNLIKSQNQIPLKEIFQVLVVEDEEINFLFLETILGKHVPKIIVTHAKNGQEAVDMIKENMTFDLILMDIKTPILNGYEATKLIKAINTHIPVIAQTAYSTQEDKEKAIEAGCCDFITKPIRKEELFAKIKLYIK